VWETVSAFSNSSGGWLVLGVTDNGNNYEITGVGNVEKLSQDFLNTLRSEKFNVFIDTKQEFFTFKSKVVLAFYIPVHSSKPVYFNTQSNTFIRRGSADQRATPEEIDSMLRDRAYGTKTTETVAGTSRSSLNDTSLRRYRDYMARFNPNASYNRYDESEFLQKLRIMDGERCTFAGLLMLGKRDAVEKHFPDFRIDLLEIPGTSYTDAKQRYTFRLDEQENLWEYYFECFSRLKQKVDVHFTLTAEGFGEELSSGLVSIREALVNMLMHADYFSSSRSRIRIFTDRIEFYNPGGLPKPFSELKSKDISLPRNPVLAKLFRMVKLAENAGFGLDKIDDNWRAYNDTRPEYIIEFDSVILSFKLDTIKQPVEKDGEAPITGVETGVETTEKSSVETVNKIIGLILKNSRITITEIAKTSGIPRRSVERNIEKLKKQGLIKRIGPDKGGYWQVVSDK
jgi:ATP-dependent DNA helicase RecG